MCCRVLPLVETNDKITKGIVFMEFENRYSKAMFLSILPKK